MNKIAIPTIVLATVLVAGFVAFAPVEKASAVHTTILQSTGISSISSLNEADVAGQFDVDVTIDVDDDAQILAIYFCDFELGNDAADDEGITDITVDGGFLSDSNGAAVGTAGDNIIDDATTFATGDCVEALSESIVGQTTGEITGGLATTDSVVIEIDETDADSDDDADGVDIIVVLIGGGASPTVDAA